MTNINLDLDYFDHPKTIRLIGLLGKGSEVLPLRLWVFLARYHPRDGRLDEYLPEAIEQKLMWRGEPLKAVNALLTVGFLESTENGYKAHDWEEHQGHIWALKVRNQKVARNRWKSIKDCHSTVDTSGIPKSTSGVPQLSIPTIQSKNQNHKPPLPPLGIPPDLSKNTEEITEWLDYKREKGQTYKPKGLEALWRMIRAIPEAQRREAIHASMASNYAGIFPPRGGQNVRNVGCAAPEPGKYAKLGLV